MLSLRQEVRRHRHRRCYIAAAKLLKVRDASRDYSQNGLKGGSEMIVGSRLRELREAKKLSQGDMEKRTGLLRCYISRVENGHTVPAIELSLIHI